MAIQSLEGFFDDLVKKEFSSDTCTPPRGPVPWIVLTGGPCSGKTTLLNYVAELGVQVVEEQGRKVIEAALQAGFGQDVVFSNAGLLQATILRAKIRKHASLSPARPTVIEDGLPESLAYFRFHGLQRSNLKSIVSQPRYSKIFYCESLPLITEPARPQSEEERQALGAAKMLAYRDVGYEPERLEVDSIEERGRRVLVAVEQLGG